MLLAAASSSGGRSRGVFAVTPVVGGVVDPAIRADSRTGAHLLIDANEHAVVLVGVPVRVRQGARVDYGCGRTGARGRSLDHTARVELLCKLPDDSCQPDAHLFGFLAKSRKSASLIEWYISRAAFPKLLGDRSPRTAARAAPAALRWASLFGGMAPSYPTQVAARLKVNDGVVPPIVATARKTCGMMSLTVSLAVSAMPG